MASESMKQPATRYIDRMRIITTIGDTGSPPRKLEAALGIPVTAMKWPKTVAPATMVMIMDVMSSVSLTASANFLKSRLRRSSPMAMAAAVPTPAA